MSDKGLALGTPEDALRLWLVYDGKRPLQFAKGPHAGVLTAVAGLFPEAKELRLVDVQKADLMDIAKQAMILHVEWLLLSMQMAAQAYGGKIIRPGGPRGM